MKILFVHQGLQSFVQKDLNILQSVHDVRSIHFTGRKNLARNILPDLWRLWFGVLWCDLTFSWFGKLHAFFAVLFSKIMRKKAVVVGGGDDVERGELAGKPYGFSSTIPCRYLTYYAFGKADIVSTVSQFSLQQAVANVGALPQKTLMIYHGFDGKAFRKVSGITKEPCVLTIGAVNKENYYRKGHKLFVEAARLLPDTLFYLGGAHADDTVNVLKSQAVPNIIYTGELSTIELIALMSKSAVYVQASAWECFGCSLAEAMLCECIPVVSRQTALPEVVGDCGLYVDLFDPEALAEKIKEALQAPPEIGKRARQRIVDHFPLEKRQRELLAAIELLERR